MSDPFRAVPMLLLSPPDSELSALLHEADRLVQREPELLELVEADLDRHAKRKKAVRLQDAEWRRARSEGLPTVLLEPTQVEPDKLRLETGRPRTSAYVVYMFLVGRGYYGGFKSSEALVLLQESTTLAVLLANQGCCMPASSTLHELVAGRTQTIPVEVSVDDGYASRQGRQQLKDRGVKVVSISGSKGKRITPAEDWDDPDYQAARHGRSAVESLMFTIKHGFDFGRVARRGMQNGSAPRRLRPNAFRIGSSARRPKSWQRLSSSYTDSNSPGPSTL